MEIKKILSASIFPILVALIFNVMVGVSFNQASSLLSSFMLYATLIFSYGGNFVIYSYSGYRSGKKFGLNALEGGLTTALSFFAVHTIYMIFFPGAMFILVSIIGIVINFIIGSLFSYWISRKWY